MVNSKKCYVIAEAGVNHNGSEKLALQLIEVAAKAGADAIKFQTFHAEKVVRAGVAKAEYQTLRTGDGDQLSMLRNLQLSEDAYRKIVTRCVELGIEFMSTPFDEESALFLVELGIHRIKVPSGELTNRPFIEFLAGLDLPLIVSTGMATLGEVQEAIDWINGVGEKKNFSTPVADRISLLHCTSNYPTQDEDVNLLAMCTLAKKFGLAAGYSDHTAGTTIATAAAALGASVIEKHFTLDRNLPGPDHQASLEPGELGAMVEAIRKVERALGDGVKKPRACELPVRDVVRRSLTLSDDVSAGHKLCWSDLLVLRPGTGIPPKDLSAVVGRTTAKALPAGTTLTWNDLE